MKTKEQKKEYLLRELETRSALCSQMLKQLPDGDLSLYTKKGHAYYSTHIEGRTRHLSKSDPLIQQLKDRHLVEVTLRAIEKQISLLKSDSPARIPFDPNELLDGFPAAYQDPSSDIFQAIGFEDARVWAKQPYVKNPNHPEHLTVTAHSGLLVRSRIEAGIANEYDALGIPFRYDELLVLPNGKKIYTDFHPLIPGVFRDLRHEHFGMLTDPYYRKNEFLWKHDQFIRAGLVPQSDILYTFDGPDGEVDYPLLRRQILDWIERMRNE